MRKLSMFNNISLDGYFTDARNEMYWSRRDDPEWQAFTAANASGKSMLMFGRVTYELMVGFWTSPAAQAFPEVAKGMNASRKLVFSRTVTQTGWNNTTLTAEDPAAAVRRLKAETGPDIVILGSGSLVAQLTQAGLIDEYQIALIPIALGAGRTLFEGVDTRPTLTLTQSRAFANGAVFVRYQGEVS